MWRSLSIVIFLAIWLTVFPAYGGEVRCFQPDGSAVDPHAYMEQARHHNAEVARIRAERRAARVDTQGRPLVDAQGRPIRYSQMAAFDVQPRGEALSYWAIGGKSSSAGGDKKKFWKKAKSGEAFMVGKDPYKTAKGIDKAMYDQAFRRAMQTGDMSGLYKWKEGMGRRRQGLLTREDYETLEK